MKLLKKGLLFLSTILSFTISSQSLYQDSLQTALESAEGGKRIAILYQLGHSYGPIDSVKASYYINKGRAFSESTDYTEGLIRGKIEGAYLQLEYGQPHLAIESILQLFHLYSPLSFHDSIMVTDVLSIATWRLGAVSTAIDYKKEHSRLQERTKDLVDDYYSIENVAYLYGQIQQYDSANFYYAQAYHIAEDLHYVTMLMHCNNNMGYNFYIQNRPEMALEKYNLAISLFQKIGNPSTSDSLLYAIINGNIGGVNVEQNDYVQASEKLEEATRILKKLNAQGNSDSLHYGSYLITYAKLELTHGKYASAEDKLKKALVNLRNSPKDMMKYYPVLAELYEKTGRKNLAIEALKNQLLINEQIAREKTNTNIHALLRFQESRIKKEFKLLSELIESQEKVNVLKIQLIVGTSSLVLIILLIIFYKYRTNQRKKREIIEIEKDMTQLKLRNKSLESRQLKDELNFKSKDLVSFAIDITRKHDFIKEILNRLNKLKTAKDIKTNLKETIIYTKSQLLIDNNLQLFQDNINKINHEFMARLQEIYPDLTLNEQQICALLRLQLTTKEIATVKNISPDSVKVLRHRLRKKMKLDSNTNLTKFLDDLV